MEQKIHLRFIVISIFSSLQILAAGNSFSQTQIATAITKESGNKTSGYGRDFWFAIPLNYSPTDRSTKYFNVYVNSLRNTAVNFQIDGGPIIQKTISAGMVGIFTSPTLTKPNADIPLSTEIYSSGIVEQKAIHVWSDDADINVYLFSHRDYSSGGMYVIPNTGWGKEYVVSAYESIFDPTGQTDWPSEFVIVANQDNTIATITPNWDLRKDGFPSVIEHPKQIPFTVNLNKGECIQYQTVLPVNDGECDVTGTIISSNNSIGVMGASVAPYIPYPYGFGDYCLSMLQPIRVWSDNYFTAPFAGRIYGGDAYCVIGTKAQTIYRNGVKVASPMKYADHIFLYDSVSATPPAVWTSDAPFELMQYIPSATFGTGNPLSTNRNSGDADMCSINPTDQFAKSLYFQIPTIDLASGQTNFTNYVNILLPASHESRTTYDGTLLNLSALSPNVQKLERLAIPGTSWEAVRLTYSPGQGEGAHIVVSDTGVGVYVYGYGTDDSYSWSGNLGVATMNSLDTIPPYAVITGECFSTHVALSDSRPDDSKLNSIVIDSLFNMSFTIDPNFVSGAGIDSSYYDLHVIDSTQEAFALVSVYDFAGNRTNIKSTYIPQMVSIDPSIENFGVVQVGTTICRYITFTNIGKNPYSYQSIKLIFGNKGFVIDSTGNNSPIHVGGTHTIRVCFSALTSGEANDTLEISDGCLTIDASVFSLNNNSSVSQDRYFSSLSTNSSDYLSISSQLDHGSEVVLLPAVPNPAAASGTSVRFIYGLRSDSPLELVIYDILGNYIATIIHFDHQSAGIYEADFPIAANIQAGSYIYRLAAAGRVLSGKLVVTR